MKWNGKEYNNDNKIINELHDGAKYLKLDIVKKDISNEKVETIKNNKKKHCLIF